MAAAHLVECGYRDILHLTGDLNWSDAIDRLRGFREFCEQAGIEPRVVEGRSWDPAEGYRAGRQILSAAVPRAIFTGNDQLALGLLSAISEAGLRVPHAIAVAAELIDGKERRDVYVDAVVVPRASTLGKVVTSVQS